MRLVGLPGPAPGTLLASLGLLLLDLGAVEEDQLDQLGRGAGEHDGSRETLAHDHGQQAAVVEVAVRDEDGIHVRRVVGQRDAAALRFQPASPGRARNR